jgi:hypothetical protein
MAKSEVDYIIDPIKHIVSSKPKERRHLLQICSSDGTESASNVLFVENVFDVYVLIDRELIGPTTLRGSENATTLEKLLEERPEMITNAGNIINNKLNSKIKWETIV